MKPTFKTVNSADFQLTKSRPGKLLLLTTSAVVGSAMILPHTPLGSLLSFVRPPTSFWGMLATFAVGYMVLAEALKRWFYRRICL